MTSCDAPFPRWTIVGILPHGTAALYAPSELSVRDIVNQIAGSVIDAGKFLGYPALGGDVLYLTDEEHLFDGHDLEEALKAQKYRLVVVHPLSNFKARKDVADANTHLDYFILNRLAHRFKVTILVTPEKRTDEVDFAVDTLITFKVPATADDSPTYPFKVESRDVPPIRGYATFNPTSRVLEEAKGS